MKTSIRTFVLAIAFTASFAFSSFAEDKETKKVTGFGTGIFVAKNHKLFVSVDKYNDANAIILVTDKKGKTIYREQLGKKIDKIRKVYDLNDLPAGDYNIEIFSDGEKVTKTISVSEPHIQRSISLR
ncbi:hypothetical protein [Dyadobacter chenhuakuii]|uniref:Secreted protein (Por secretion system target) n=1 Tax=Dyadobacter chenhuakuii TaxID=2909339 RepID=A0ABY4XKK5_9BACT|nr:hypothetical protein [Dyadobacter chenhuakuii]MCF2493834.1 hypothetical protein [Dyadobacter chenhuakuii]USJ30966.1 hypothetical protein NFI80_24300 [Dyadobacter chenhuakuii]